MRAELRRHPWRSDGLLALALLVASGPQLAAGRADAPTRAGYVVVTAVLVTTILVRRRYPVAAFATAAAIGAAQVVLGVQYGAPERVFALQPNNADVAILVLLYTLAAYRPRPVSVTGLAVCLAGVAAAVARWAPAHDAYSGTAVLGAAAGLGGITLTAWVLGDSVAYRYRRAYYASVEERAARLEAERDAQARIAAAAERARQMAERARDLQEKRTRAVDESVSRLRRIERDLHDGAQVRLAALAMNLGEIRESLKPGDGHIRSLVETAHANAKQTLTELRDLARGIHPPVLDRGLAAALATLADTSPIPLSISVRAAAEGPGQFSTAAEGPGRFSATARPSPAIEAIAYFCAAELIANAAKHSGASHVTIVTVEAEEEGGRLVMTVTDDGSGGARIEAGGGLAGLLERVQTVDGHLAIDSPPGGPTTVTVELPGHA
jgi:signal transduction histidine kinase